jgi:hypothetical protein
VFAFHCNTLINFGTPRMRGGGGTLPRVFMPPEQVESSPHHVLSSVQNVLYKCVCA